MNTEQSEQIAVLFIALCKSLLGTNKVWRSKTHSKVNFNNSPSWPGIFILGINTEAGKQITYHLSEDFWKECEFANTLNVAPDYDGHTQKDVLQRIQELKPKQ